MGLVRHLSFQVSYRVLALMAVATLFGISGSIVLTKRTVPVTPSTQEIVIRTDGSATVGGNVVARSIPRGGEAVLKLPVYDPQSTANSYFFTVVLPDTMTTAVVSSEVISIQDTFDGAVQPASEHSLSVYLPFVLNDAITSVVLKFNADDFSYPWFVRAAAPFIGYSTLEWGLIAVMLVFGIFVSLRLQSVRLGAHPKRAQKTPPQGLRPLEAAILLDSKIDETDLAAFVYDLANRGHLQMIGRGGDIYVLPQDSGAALASYESHFLSLIAPYTEPRPLWMVLKSLEQDLFSLTVSSSFVEIYASLTERGLFKENPRVIHLRYKTVAIVIQVLSVIQLILSYFLLPETPGLILIGLAGYLVGFLVYRTGYKVLRLTPLGLSTVAELHQFRKYLTEPAPIGMEGLQGNLFYDYLPYAMVLGVGDMWLARFRETNFQIPTWFTSMEDMYSPVDFNERVALVTDAIANVFTRLVDPNVD